MSGWDNRVMAAEADGEVEEAGRKTGDLWKLWVDLRSTILPFPG